jgi:AcrR family transcriptional regulator
MSRRKPVQARAARRRSSLLEAAVRLLESGGYESVTTNAIAKEAGTSVGTVYDYFGNKEELLIALLERYRERLGATLMEALAGAGDVSVDTLVDRGVRAFAEFYQREPGYAELWLGSQLVGPLREAGAAWGTEFGRTIGALITDRVGLPKRRAERVALALVHAVSSVVTLALDRSGRERQRLIDEAVVLARGYLHEAAEQE